MAKAPPAPAPAADQARPKKGPSIVVQLGVLFALTGAAVGAGWFAGMTLGGQPEQAAVGPAPVSGAVSSESGQSGHGEAKPDGTAETAPDAPHLVVLEPITANLASPAETWARMELAVVFRGPPDQRIADAIHQDFLAYLRSLRLPQLEGSSGFQHLVSDLEERAGLRSGGRVTRVLIRTLLFE